MCDQLKQELIACSINALEAEAEAEEADHKGVEVERLLKMRSEKRESPTMP